MTNSFVEAGCSFGLTSCCESQRAKERLTTTRSYTYVADRDQGLQIIDTTLPDRPRLLATIPSGWARDVATTDGRPYLLDEFAGLRILDISEPTQPRILGDYAATNAHSVAVAGRYAWIAFANLRPFERGGGLELEPTLPSPDQILESRWSTSLNPKSRHDWVGIRPSRNGA